MSSEERAEIEETISQYQQKQELQQQLATVYTDGRYVYFEIKEFDENTPDEIKGRFPNGINVEIFKNIFDIKDKAIRHYNDLSSVWRQDEDGNCYFDYTGNRLLRGDTIKVPVSKIMTDDINLNY